MVLLFKYLYFPLNEGKARTFGCFVLYNCSWTEQIGLDIVKLLFQVNQIFLSSIEKHFSCSFKKCLILSQSNHFMPNCSATKELLFKKGCFLSIL